LKEKLYIYTRVSQAIQEDGTSLEEQAKIGKLVAAQNDLEPVIYNEGSHTSSQEDPFLRPRLRELFIEVEEGKVQNLFVWQLDRLARDGIAKAHLTIRLMKANVRVFTSMGQYDFTNPQDVLMFEVVSATATFENKLRAMRTRVGKLTKLRAGEIWKGGDPPYGYRIENKQLVVNPQEGKWVERIFQEYLKGNSVEEIRWTLTTNKVKTRRGNTIWSGASINAILHGNAYRGFFTYTDRDPSTKEVIEVIKVPCCSPLKPDLVVEVDKALERRQRKSTPRKDSKVRLLRDFLVCEQCNQLMSPRVYEKKHIQIYYCPTNERNYRRKGMATQRPKCSLGSVNLKETDNFVWTTFLDVLEKSHHFKALVKNAVLGDQRTYEQQKEEITTTKKRLGRNQSKLKNERALLKMLTDAKDPEHKTAIFRQKTKIAELQELVTQDQLFLAHNEQDKVWVDWVRQFGQQIEDYRSLEDSETRLPILQKFLRKVEVRKIDPQNRGLRFYFNFPFVEDSYSKDSGEVISGSYEKEYEVDGNSLSGKVGRPKKQKP